MRTETVTRNLYKFDELSEQAQEKAIERMSDINVDFDWWDFTYDDAKQVGVKIEGFDIDMGKYCQIELINSPTEIADKIMSEHGKNCETYKIAAAFLADRDALVEKYSDGIIKGVVTEENEYDFDNECDDLEDEFKRALSEEYASMLQREYDYLTSRKAIIETIETNDYEFTVDGKLA